MKLRLALIYFDDIIMFSCSAEELILQVCAVILLLQKVRVTFNVRNGKFFTERIHYLGHVIRREKLEAA